MPTQALCRSLWHAVLQWHLGMDSALCSDVRTVETFVVKADRARLVPGHRMGEHPGRLHDSAIIRSKHPRIAQNGTSALNSGHAATACDRCGCSVSRHSHVTGTPWPLRCCSAPPAALAAIAHAPCLGGCAAPAVIARCAAGRFCDDRSDVGPSRESCRGECVRIRDAWHTDCEPT